jgi:hypothetical protein
MDTFPLTSTQMGVSGDDAGEPKGDTAGMTLRNPRLEDAEGPLIEFRARENRLEPELAGDCRLAQNASVVTQGQNKQDGPRHIE